MMRDKAVAYVDDVEGNTLHPCFSLLRNRIAIWHIIVYVVSSETKKGLGRAARPEEELL